MANKASPYAAPGSSLPSLRVPSDRDASDTKVEEVTGAHFAAEKEVESQTPHEWNPDYDFDENLEQANTLFKTQNKDKARELYLEIYNTSLKTTLQGKDMVLPITSAMGVVSTYDSKSEDKVKWASIALNKADQIYDQRGSWEALTQKGKLDAYKALYNGYLKIMGLIEILPREHYSSTKYPNIDGQSVLKICMKLTTIRAVTNPVEEYPFPHVNREEDFFDKRPPLDKRSSRLGFIFAVAIGSLVALIATVVIYKRVFVKK